MDPPSLSLQPALITTKEPDKDQDQSLPMDSKYATVNQHWLMTEGLKENVLESPKVKYEEEFRAWPCVPNKQPLGMSQRLNLSG